MTEMGAESSSSPQHCPLMAKLIRPTVHNKISKGGFNCDAAKKKQYSLPGTSRPCYPLSGLQRLLRKFRKPDQLEEPKIVGLSIIIENSWSYNCCKYQSKMESCCKSKPQILNKSMLAAQCKVRSTNDGSKCRNSVLLTPPSVVSSNVVASTTLPAIDFLDECYLCKRSLGPGLDTYMYRGDRAFCSVECRLKQIAMDEPRDKIASAALQRPVRTTSPRTRRSDKNRTHVVQGRGLATAA